MKKPQQIHIKHYLLLDLYVKHFLVSMQMKTKIELFRIMILQKPN